MLRLPEWTITHASANLESVFGADPREVIGKPLGELMSRQAIHRLRNTLQFVTMNGEPERMTNIAMGFRRARFDLSLYADGDRAVIEIEPRERDQKSGDDSLSLLRAMRSRLRTVRSAREVCERVARHVRSLTGYDRVMVIRYREDGSGEVVADEQRGHLPSRLGLLYDAEATAGQATALTGRARFCYVPDTSFVPVPFVPGPVPAGGLAGLNAPGLRSVPPARVEELRRGGIGATYVLTVGLLDAPWGAVVCQNAEPRPISSEMRLTLDFFSNAVALQIGFLSASRTFEEQAAAREARLRLLLDRQLDLEPEDDLPALSDALRAYFDFDGIGFWNGMRLRTVGLAADGAAAMALIDRLDAESDIVFRTDEFGSLAEGDSSCGAVAGVLAVRATDNPRRYLLLFRAERPRTVRWGRADGADPSSVREERIAGRSAPWSGKDVELAYALRGKLLKTMLRRKNAVEQESSARLGRQEILIAELNHRVKNLLAVFQSLVNKTGGTATTPEEYRQALAGRIRSLTLAHDQMSGGDDDAVVSIRSLVEGELAPFRAGDRRVGVEGPEFCVTARAVVVLALVLHELATNAEKYGAFARPSGELAIRWRRGDDDGGIVIEWEETGEGKVTAPQRRGFGSTVVERMIPFELGGTADIRYLPQGLLARFSIPAAFVTETAGPAGPAARAPGRGGLRKIAAQRALVVEDNMIIALEAEEMLRRLGCVHVDIAAQPRDAESLIRANAYDIVALDLNLGSGNSLSLADELGRSGIPFFFATGYGERTTLPDRFAAAPVVAKPYSDEALSGVLADLLGEAKGEDVAD